MSDAPREPNRRDDGSYVASTSRPAPIVYAAGQDDAQLGPRNVRARVGAPQLDGSIDASPVGKAELIDAKVGDVNGRPIFASSFLEPLDAQIAAEAERDSPREWTVNTYQLLRTQVFEVVQNELIKAEARESLSEQQKTGLRYFLQELQAKQIRQGRGSRVEAERAIAATGEATTLDEWIERQEEKNLIRFFLQDHIYRRINVTRRELQLEYERAGEEFTSPPAARYRLIQINGNNAEARAEIERRLAAGEAFEEIAASSVNAFRAADGGEVERTLEGDRSTTDLFNASRFPNLNRAAQTLAPGGVAGPLVDGDEERPRVSWLQLVTIEDNSKTLYEAQELLRDRVFKRKANEQQFSFVIDLMERASFTSIEDMADRLMDIVVDRHRPELVGQWRQLVPEALRPDAS